MWNLRRDTRVYGGRCGGFSATWAGVSRGICSARSSCQSELSTLSLFWMSYDWISIFFFLHFLSRGSPRQSARCLSCMSVLELVYCFPAGSLKLRCDNGSRLQLGFSCVARDQKRESNDPARRLALSVRRFSIRDSRSARPFARECRLQSAEGPTPWREPG